MKLFRLAEAFALVAVTPDASQTAIHDLQQGHSLALSGHFARAVAQWLDRPSTDTDAAAETDATIAATVVESAKHRLSRLQRVSPEPTASLLAMLLAHKAVPIRLVDLIQRDHLGVCFVELTAQCNERCRHCYADSSPEVTTALSRETMAAVVRDARAAGFSRVQFTGGDPLISPHLLPLVALAAELEFETIEIYTNALALTERLLKPLLERGCQFAVSLYSHDPDRHDAITGVGGSHARTVANVQRAVQAGAVVRMAVVVMETNAADLDATLDFCRDELGVPSERIGYDTMHGIGRGADFRRPRPLATTDAPAPTAGPRLGIHTGMPMCAPATDSAEKTAAETSAGAKFSWWQGKAAVAPTGEVFPCVFARFVALGNVLERPLGAILADPRPLVAADYLAQTAGMNLSELCEFLRGKLQCLDCRTSVAALLMAHHAQTPIAPTARLEAVGSDTERKAVR